ncbi:MAG TPA: helix-turn-helix transcriptional regulator [Dermatophilaceae bacterium]|nr:helix-turn-helix transcriptional regulator [Dermatophilaceae bacterium]
MRREIDEYVWVLTNARKTAADRRLRTVTGLGRALEVHPAQVTRWEHGEVRPSDTTLRRYEETLGLSPHRLGLPLAFLRRTRDRLGRSTRALTPIEPDDRVRATDLLERALGGEPMSGVDWLDLTDVLSRHDGVLLRERDWTHLLSRLVLELAVNRSVEYAARWESATRIVGTPASAGALLTLAEAAVGEAEPMPFAEYAGLLQYSADPAALALLTAQTLRPRTEDTQWAAIFALGAWAQDPRMVVGLRGGVLPVCVALLADPDTTPRMLRAAGWLARSLDPEGAPHLARALAARGADELAVTVVHSGAVRPDGLRVARAREAATAIESAGLPGSSPMLLDLLDEALSSADQETRGNALGALMLLPQGVPVGRWLAARLQAAVRDADVAEGLDLLAGLAWLAQDADLPVLLELLLDPATPVPLLWPLAKAFGNAASQPTGVDAAAPAGPPADAPELPADWAARVVTWASDAVARRGSAEGSTCAERSVSAASYALGMRGELAGLRRVAEVAGAPTSWSGSPQWWLRLPVAVRPSSGRPAA